MLRKLGSCGLSDTTGLETASGEKGSRATHFDSGEKENKTPKLLAFLVKIMISQSRGLGGSSTFTQRPEYVTSSARGPSQPMTKIQRSASFFRKGLHRHRDLCRSSSAPLFEHESARRHHVKE